MCLCGVVWPTASQCLQRILFPPGTVAPLVTYAYLFFRVLIYSDNCLISSCCLATVSTDIARLAVNSASRPPFAAVCVAAAEMLSKYPSIKSSIWFVSWGSPSVYLWPCLFSGSAPNRAEPPNGFYSTSLSASARRLATYAFLEVFFHSDQVCSSSRIFYHSRVSVLYSLD